MRTKALHRAVVSAVGSYVAIEYKHRFQRLPKTIRAWLWEGREVRLAKRTLGRIPDAEVITVVPTFRRPEHLSRAVDSALRQTVRDHLVLVVDDGGGLGGALPDDPRILTLTLSRNIGIAGVVRNVGIRISRSRYVAFLDDDNEWEPDHLAVSLGALSRGADMAYTMLRRYRPDGSQADVVGRPYDRRALRYTNFVDSNSIVVRRVPGLRMSRMPRRRGDVTLEDWEFAFRMGRRRRVVHVPVPTVRYLFNPETYFRRDSIPRD